GTELLHTQFEGQSLLQVSERCEHHVGIPGCLQSATLVTVLRHDEAAVSAYVANYGAKSQHLLLWNGPIPMLALDNPQDVEPGVLASDQDVDIVVSSGALY